MGSGQFSMYVCNEAKDDVSRMWLIVIAGKMLFELFNMLESQNVGRQSWTVSPERFQYLTLFSETICGGNLTAMTGAITSPNYPDPYPKGIECVWNIRCPKGRGLLMLIPNISIPLTKDCSDHLIMRASASPFSKTTYYQCESYSSPVTFISRSKNLYVKFTSRADGEIANGFKMFYVTFEGSCQQSIKVEQESMKVKEVIPHIGPIPIVIPLNILELLRDPVFQRELTDSQSYVPNH